MTKTKDPDRPPVHAVVLCVAVLAVLSLLVSGCLWCHAMGWRSTRVVDRISATNSGDYYTSRPRYVMVGPFDGYMTKPEIVHYQDWVVVSKDGFELTLSGVDPRNPPTKVGGRYTGWWK